MPESAGAPVVTEHDDPRPSPDTGARPPFVVIPEPVRILLCSTLGLDATPYPSRKRFDLVGFSEILNGLQGTYQFVPHDAKWDLGRYDQLHIYTDEHYYRELRRAKTDRGVDYAIAITTDDLERAVFNTHKELEGIGIITVSRYLDYLPPGGSLQRYLAFLVLCETMCLAGKWQFEHSRHARCLFDMCRNKSDLTLCLSRPHIDDDCEAALRSAGFKESHISDAYKILGYVGTPSWSQIVIGGIREPGAGFVLGVAATLGSAILIAVSVTAAEALFAGSALVWLATLGFIAGRSSPRRPQQASRLRKLGIRLSRQ
jgi:hypothetical protein